MYKDDFPPEVRRQAMLEAKRDIARASEVNDETIRLIRGYRGAGLPDEELIATAAKNLLDCRISVNQVIVLWAEALNRLEKAEQP